jgi:hypothetical protein
MEFPLLLTAQESAARGNKYGLGRKLLHQHGLNFNFLFFVTWKAQLNILDKFLTISRRNLARRCSPE